MSEDIKIEEHRNSINLWRKQHNLILLITIAIVVSFALVTVSLSLYNSSGAAQLDLSRPGYSAVRDQAQTDKKYDAFPSTGVITEKTIKEFKALYDERAKEATAVDAFSGDVLNNTTLGIDAPANSAQ